MRKYLNPFTDIGWKKLFGQEANKELLIAFLNDLLEGERRITDLSFMDKEIVPESQNGRMIIFDILCKETDGTRFIVEMQNQYQDYFFDRSLYYLCRMVNDIYFLNFRLPELKKFRTDTILADRDTGELVNGNIRQVYLCLPYFTLQGEDCQTDFERWIYILKNMETKGITPFDTRQRAIFKKLLDVADVDSLSPEERYRYEENLKAYRDYNNTMRYALRTSREEGMAEGLEKGRAEGRMDIAVNLKKEGLSVELIQKLTGLSPQEIDKL